MGVNNALDPWEPKDANGRDTAQAQMSPGMLMGANGR